MSAAGLLFAQILVIIAACRAAGALARRAGQPAVIGEIAAGLALGPSALGALWPAAHRALFPPGSLSALQLLSQVGVVLFLFSMGLELDLPALRRRAGAAVAVSHASILLPLLLGAGAGRALHGAFAPAGVPISTFCLFLGVAMSVTAFPVLARILEERGLSRTPLGASALACAAVDDATAWCLLAALTAIASAGSAAAALRALAWTAGFVALALGVLRPRAAAWAERARGAGQEAFVLVLCALGGAVCTEWIGIHGLFGAFVAGVAVSGGPALRDAARQRLGTFVSALLVPLFFAFTGLRTRLDALGDPGAWAAFALIMACAVGGKFGGTVAAARWMGDDWREALSLGVLMNTRGLMELIVLNAGYDLGILSPRLFAILVLMAMATTMMTGPALAFLERRASARRPAPAAFEPA